MLGVSWDSLWTFSSQFHGHSSWLVCEVALRNKAGSEPHTMTKVGPGAERKPKAGGVLPQSNGNYILA